MNTLEKIFFWLSLGGYLKGQSHEIFDPQFCSPSTLPRFIFTDYHPKIFSNLVLISHRFLRICVDSTLCGIEGSQLCAVPHSVGSIRKF
jgi:hypothetical protein